MGKLQVESSTSKLEVLLRQCLPHTCTSQSKRKHNEYSLPRGTKVRLRLRNLLICGNWRKPQESEVLSAWMLFDMGLRHRKMEDSSRLGSGKWHNLFMVHSDADSMCRNVRSSFLPPDIYNLTLLLLWRLILVTLSLVQMYMTTMLPYPSVIAQILVQLCAIALPLCCTHTRITLSTQRLWFFHQRTQASQSTLRVYICLPFLHYFVTPSHVHP